ncbi:MAG: hypothetical protein CMD88_04380 [Gammaproteobacteria bacterium]|nr:hypothetical protein [Gammaproteobacteria bacterium]|tara:strand:- start:80304 stop:80873 length:570 start_codon:yes stop_codon:yes gene_type:complete
MDNYYTNPIVFIMTMIVSFFQFILIMRLLFEINRVNFYNPICQFVVKFTNPIINPFRLLPLNIGRIDLFIIIIIVLVTALKIYIPYSFSSFDFSLNTLIVFSFGKFIQDVLNIYWFLIIISAIGSWFHVFNDHPLFIVIDELCVPLYNVVRNYLPPLSGLDFSPIIILIMLKLTEMIIIPPIFNLAQNL